MNRIQVPRFLETPEKTWVKCEDARNLPGGESACLVNGVDGTRIIIAPSGYFDLAQLLVQAIKVGTAEFDEETCLVDFPSGQRLLISEELVQTRHGDSI